MAHNGDELMRFVLPCDNLTKVTLLLFADVTNCRELKEEAKAGKINACLLRNSLVLNEFQVLVATNMAVNAKNCNSMKTRNIFTEIMYFMSCTRNISDSLTKFGVQESDKSFLAVLINDDDQNAGLNKLVTQVNGQLTSLNSNLTRLSDTDAIKKIYKIKSEELERDLLESVVSRISTKEVMTF